MREKDKYKALHRRGNIGGKRWKIDHDYADQLTDKQKEYYNAFLEEYYIANFNHESKPVLKGPGKKKKSYDANNSANRCVSTRGYRVEADVAALLDARRSNDNQEDILIEFLDNASKERKKT